MTDSLPSVDSALLPASVRNAGPEAQKLYGVALSFEQLLTQQVAKSLTASLHAPGDDDDSSGSSASTSMAEQMLPTALAQGMTQAGGLGLADQLYRSMGGATAVTAPKAAGS
jgi:Rod binding domain-containing protein